MKKVLVIEDDKYFTDDLAEYLQLENLDYEIVDSTERFKEVENSLSMYSCVILDIMMRRGEQFSEDKVSETGELIYKAIRDRLPELLIIVVSAKNKQEIDIDFNNPFTDYIGKPLGENTADLLAKIKGVQNQ